MFADNFDIESHIRKLKISISLQDDYIKYLKEDKHKHSDLNAWLFESNIEVLEYTKNILTNNLKMYELSLANSNKLHKTYFKLVGKNK